MNSIFIKSSEVSALAADIYSVAVSGQRVQQICEEHQLQAGIELDCVIQNVGRGKLSVIEITEQSLIARAIITALPSERLPLRLAVAFTRPQTTKKIMQLAASFGVRELNFVKTEKVVPSYLQSKSLKADQLEYNFILGCQQACEAVFPAYKNFYSLSSFIESCSPDETLLFGDLADSASRVASQQATTLILGPEAGFTAEEKELLLTKGFQPVSLGARMLRVEVAAAALIGRLMV